MPDLTKACLVEMDVQFSQTTTTTFYFLLFMLVNHLMPLFLSSVYSSFILSEVDENNGGIIGKIERMWVKTGQEKH